ncbi:MAG: hypothetical protein VX764_06380 [Planctomycetota bacterium]|nr:hypothetical protein [Planctomycetota bacterium]
MILAVAKEDAPGAISLLQQKAQEEWEHSSDEAQVEGSCPACGTVSRESEDTCSDCGLRLR